MRWACKRIAFQIVLFCLLLVSSLEARENQNKKVFSFRIQTEPETLDWNRAHTPLETYILVNLMEGLFKLDSNFRLVPALADRWSVSKDQKVYQFHIRSGVKWSDGVPLKAKDFLYSWKRLLTPKTAAAYAYFLYDIEGAQEFNQGKVTSFDQVGIRVLDEDTLEVHLSRPVSFWPMILTFWVTFPLREDRVERPGYVWDRPDHLVTLGPYLLDRHELNSQFVLKANPNYYGTRGNIDEIHAWIVSDDATALSLYETGHLSFLPDLSILDLRRLEGRADLKKFPYLKITYLGFVIHQSPVSDLHLRRAIAQGIDKSQFGKILKGFQEGASSFLPIELRKALGMGDPPAWPFDPNQARSEIRRNQSEKMTLTLPSMDKSLLVGQILQSNFKKNLGIELELQPWDNKAYRASLDRKTNPLFLASWSADYADPDNFFSVFLSDSGNNRTSFQDSLYDRWVKQARYSVDSSERRNLYQQIEKKLLRENIVLVPLYYEPNLALISPKVRGLELNHFNYLNLKSVELID